MPAARREDQVATDLVEARDRERDVPAAAARRHVGLPAEDRRQLECREAGTEDSAWFEVSFERLRRNEGGAVITRTDGTCASAPPATTSATMSPRSGAASAFFGTSFIPQSGQRVFASSVTNAGCIGQVYRTFWIVPCAIGIGYAGSTRVTGRPRPAIQRPNCRAPLGTGDGTGRRANNGRNLDKLGRFLDRGLPARRGAQRLV